MEELADRFGTDRLKAGIESYIAGAEQRVRDELGQLDAGTYLGEYIIDGDGIEHDREPVVRVRVEVGDELTGKKGSIRLDFSETDDQALGAINAGFSQALTGALYAVRCFVDSSIPMNEGCFTPVDVIFRKGSLLDPYAPAACGGRVVAVTAACEAVVAALSQARPDLATAASSVIHPYTLAAPSRLEPWLLLSYEYGGLGARRGSDGPSATGSFFLGGRNTVPQIEPLEATLPIVFERQSLVPDSGGAGKWRGGLGVETRIRALSETEFAMRNERVKRPPCGREGGHDGLAGDQYAIEVDGGIRPLPPKAANLRLAAGETLVLTTSGGGGLGDPSERDPERVAEDVAEGLVSERAALEHYAVGDPS
ncbi:MAG TPA: hydantoinase B/oxoprolinase family protein, partial [Microbacterium sp.]|nr:hydantoinase B/oxoprolinase family protein [Microbacterium sp.]